MENFAEYILNERELAAKMEIMYYLAKKTGIYFNKTVVFKTEIAKMFIDYMKLDIDKNLILTACLLCNCKKIENAQKLGKLKTYTIEGALYLQSIGFEKRFCKICEEVNRYSKSEPRERESDILELVDQFGGMLLDRPERIGFNPDEAIVLLEHRNLKDVYNRYLQSFVDFVEEIEKINIDESFSMNAFKKLTKIYNETDDLIEFIKKVINDYEPKFEKQMQKYKKEEAKKIFENPNRSLFSEQTTKRIIGLIEENELKKQQA